MCYLATIAPFGFPDLDPSALLPLYRQLGCRAAQYYRNPLDPPDLAEARRLVEDLGLPFDSLHGLFGPDLDPSSPDEAIRRRAIETYRREGQLALEAGGPAVIVHPAPMVGATDPSDASKTAGRLGALETSLVELAGVGREQGVTYLLENVPGNYYFGHDVAQMAGLVRQLDEPFVRMCFDTGHAHMMGVSAAALSDCLDVATYVHVTDNDGRADSHRVPGHGTLPWEELAPVMTKLPAQTPAMLELFESPQSLAGLIADGLAHHLSNWLALGM